MDKDKNTIEKIECWDDIYKYCHLLADEMIKYDFINFEYKLDLDKFILLSDDDLENLEDGYTSTCHLLPYYAIGDLKWQIIEGYRGFNAHPKYYIISQLNHSKNDKKLYYLLWFHSALYQIHCDSIDSYFDMFKNCDMQKIKIYVKKMLSICEKELSVNYNIVPKSIYKQTRKNFCPISSPIFQYPYLFNDVNIFNANVFIDYINFLINNIKSEYRFIIIHRNSEANRKEYIERTLRNYYK